MTVIIPSPLIFHSSWGDPDHNAALNLIRTTFSTELQDWLRKQVMHDESRITLQELGERLIRLWSVIRKDGYGGGVSVEGPVMVPAIKIGYGPHDYATVERANLTNDPLMRVWTDHNLYKGDMPLSEVLASIHTPNIYVAILATTDSLGGLWWILCDAPYHRGGHPQTCGRIKPAFSNDEPQFEG